MARQLTHLLSAIVAVGSLGLAEAANAESPTLQKIRSRSVLTLGYREASIPFSYLGENQKPVGMSLDLCAVLADRIKNELKKPELKIDLVPVNASNRIPLIQNGTIDIECGSTTNTPERQKQVAFSVVVFVSQPRWMTLRSSDITKVDQLRGRTVVITQGSLNIAGAQKLNQQGGYNLTVLQARDHAEALLMLRTGRAVAWYEDDVLLASARATSPNPASLTFLPESFGTDTYYGLMFTRDDAEFKTLVDSELKGLMASGKFDTIYDKWFLNPIPPNHINLNLAMSDALKIRVKTPSDELK